jgi:RNA polymerase sigma-70 factor (ECF subfamily)
VRLDVLTPLTAAGTDYGVMPSARGQSEEPAALIARIAQGDREAFGRFYDACAASAFGLIRRVVRDPAAAEEVLQDVFLQVWREAAQYDPRRGSPEAWLIMRAKTRAIDRLRSMRRRDKTFVPLVDEAMARQDDPDAPNPGVAAEERGLAQSALAQLPAAQRQVIELAFFGGLTQTEIAARLGEPLGTVKTRARLGLERLRAILKGERLPAT